MDEVTRDDVRRALTTAADALTPHVDADWAKQAADLEWDCRRVLNHLVDCMLWYAGLLARQSPVRIDDVRDGDPNASIEQLLDALDSSGHILARVVEATPPGARAYHSEGMADPTGFVAMACDELLVHTNDICEGLRVGFEPPPDLVERVTARLFPWAPEHADPLQLLLWCNGRIAIPGRARQGRGWSWWCSPLDEWDGVPRTD
jgi:uncharacterized protein (TIGR03083 family)